MSALGNEPVVGESKMAPETLPEARLQTAAQAAEGMPDSGPETSRLLAASATPGEYLDRLVAAKLYEDAVRFIAYALPPREAIWWLCLCIGRVAPEDLADVEKQALESAAGWVKDPNEKTRRRAEKAGRVADFKTPSGCAAFAAFYTGGSIAPEGLPEVPPPRGVVPRIVDGALCLAMAPITDRPRKEVQRDFLEIGLAVSRGERPWPN